MLQKNIYLVGVGRKDIKTKRLPSSTLVHRRMVTPTRQGGVGVTATIALNRFDWLLQHHWKRQPSWTLFFCLESSDDCCLCGGAACNCCLLRKER
jgi:hypothetical protein